MAFSLNRMTIYALITALEEGLRDILKLYLNDYDCYSRDLIEKSQSRVEKDIGVVFGDVELVELIDYFDLGDACQAINSNKSIIPNHIVNTVRNFSEGFDKIIKIRNRVMHARPLDFEDLPAVSELCRSLIDSDKSGEWGGIKETIKKLNEDPSFVLSLDIVNYDEDASVYHNLPLPDFDETGLIGRDDEIRKIRKLCSGSFPVISIVGEGGVGKSSLALKIAYELIEPESGFDAVVWVTSKTTQITLNEIREIKGAIDTSFGVIQEVGRNLVGSSDQESQIEDIVEYLSSFKIALFIDNLETIIDDNIRQFISALPDGSKIIITSRIGLGAYEYPVKLQGVAENYASQLMRAVSKLRNVESLYKLPEPVVRRYVNRMSRNPSYIKWFVSSVQTGLEPEAVLQNSDQFLDFCMSNVYDFLSSDAQQLTTSLQCAPGLKDIPELSYLNDFDALRTQKSIQELLTTNMLSQQSVAKGASIRTTYQLSELAKAYLGKYHKPTQVFQKSIREKKNKLNSIFEEQLNSRSRNKYVPTNISFRDKSDRVIVKKLQDAQHHIRSNNHGEAFEILKESQRLAPGYFEVARVMAYFYQKSGNLSEAREQYNLAITLSPNAPQLHYWYGKFLLREDDDLEEAVVQFELAYKLDPLEAEVALALARGYMFQHDFSNTQKIIDEFSEKIKLCEFHLIEMYYDTTVQVEYRKSDDFAKSHAFYDSLVAFEEMANRFSEIESRYKDKYIRKKLKKCEYTLRLISINIDEAYRSRVNDLEEWLSNESV